MIVGFQILCSDRTVFRPPVHQTVIPDYETSLGRKRKTHHRHDGFFPLQKRHGVFQFFCRNERRRRINAAGMCKPFPCFPVLFKCFRQYLAGGCKIACRRPAPHKGNRGSRRFCDLSNFLIVRGNHYLFKNAALQSRLYGIYKNRFS